MHPCKGIVRTYIRSGGLSTRPDDQNTLNSQSKDINDAPRDPLHGPFTWNPDQISPYSTLQLRIRLQSQNFRRLHRHRDHCTGASRSRPQSNQAPDSSAIIGIYSYILAAIYDWIRLTCFYYLIRLNCSFDLIRLNCGFDLIILNYFSLIKFNSRLTYLFYIRGTHFESHSSQALESPILARVYPKYSNNEIGVYSTILIIEIGFGENTLI